MQEVKAEWGQDPGVIHELDGSAGIQSPYANPHPGIGYQLHWHHQAAQTIAELRLTFHGSDCFLWELLQSWKSRCDRTAISIHKDKSFI